MLEGELKKWETLIKGKSSCEASVWNRFFHEISGKLVQAYRGGMPVVWVSCYAFPMELLWAFDVIPFDFEMAVSLLPLASNGKGSCIMKYAEEKGYPLESCSVHRLALGAFFKGLFPDGDLFLSSSYYCGGKARINEIIADAHGKEGILFDVPNKLDKSSVRYVREQLIEITHKLEALTGKPLDRERLRQCITMEQYG